MKRVLLLRHAEATPAQGAQQDFERPLSVNGRAEALAAAGRIAASGLHVDQMLVSPALRTQETGSIVATRLGAAARVRYEPSLYPGTSESLWAALQQLPEPVHCALLIGHNPALSALARQCGAAAELPTAGLYLAGFPASIQWSALQPEQACALPLPG